MLARRLGGLVGRVAHTLGRVATAPVVALPGYRLASAAALAWGRMLGGTVSTAGDLTIVRNLPHWSFGRGGTCVGATFLTRDLVSDAILEHEDVHRRQWQRYGLAFIPMYFFAGLDGTKNRFEIEADLEKGGYLKKPRQRTNRDVVRDTQGIRRSS